MTEPVTEPHYTVEAGRQILRDGIRVATVYSIVQTGERGALMPADADDFTHEIAMKLNTWPLLVEAIKGILDVGGYDDEGDFYILHTEGPTPESDYVYPEIAAADDALRACGLAVNGPSDRLCPECGEDIVGNDPHSPTCSRDPAHGERPTFEAGGPASTAKSVAGPTDMSGYVLTQSGASRCPTCHEYVEVLTNDTPVSNRPTTFFICWTDRLIFQAGKGPVERVS